MERGKGKGFTGWLKRGIFAECVLVAVLALLVIWKNGEQETEASFSTNTLSIEDDYIKWVDFTVSYEALCKAYDWDVETHGTEHQIHWVELLAYTAAKTGGEFGKDALKIMDKAAEKLAAGDCTMEELAEGLKYYAYYLEAYDAAIGGLVGEYREGNGDSGGEGYEECYGLKGYFPLARGFDYTHYDDFGVNRSYGYSRPHLGSYVIIVSSRCEASKIKGFRCFRPRSEMPCKRQSGGKIASFSPSQRENSKLDTIIT